VLIEATCALRSFLGSGVVRGCFIASCSVAQPNSGPNDGRNILDDAPVMGRVIHMAPAFGHEFFYMARFRCVGDIPANASSHVFPEEVGSGCVPLGNVERIDDNIGSE
jgi:hypothetical protein